MQPDVSAMSPPLLWFVIGTALLLSALLGIDSDGLLLVGGLGGLLLTLVTIALPALPAALQGLLFALLALAGYLALRRWDRRQQERALPPPATAERAEVISGFDGQGQGRVRWQGQSWAAVNLAPETCPKAGEEVTVMGREGTRLQVLPRALAGGRGVQNLQG